MKGRSVTALILGFFAVVQAWANLLPLHSASVVASSTARYLLRYDESFELFELSADQKAFSLVRKFPPSNDRFAIKALVSDNGPVVVAFGHTHKAAVTGRDEIVCTYSSRGELLRTWFLEEILSKEDMTLAVSHSGGGSLWLEHEVGIFDEKNLVIFVGPTDSDRIIEKRYVYVLDLKKGTWTKLRDEVLTKMPNQSPEPTAMSVTAPAAQEPRQP